MRALHERNTAGPWNRRDFLACGGGLAITGLIPASGALAGSSAAGRGPGARSCILVYLLGGPPQLDMWDLKPEAPAEIRGPFRPIATSVPGVHVSEHLPRLAARAGRYALVRSVSHHNHNHTPMIYYTLTGRPVERPEMDNDVRPPQRTDAPHVGSVVARFRPAATGLPAFIAIPEVAVRSSTEGMYKRARTPLRGGGGGFLGPWLDPLNINGEPGSDQALPALGSGDEAAALRLQRRAALLSVLEHGQSPLPGTVAYREIHRQAVVLSGAAGGPSRPFSLDAEPRPLRERYGDHRFGKSLLLARRLAEAGVPMIAVHWNEMTVCDGWDTHAQNFSALESELLPMLDQGLSALFDDLDARGLLEETLIVVMGEFGRTPRINKDAGRDHWGSCQSVLLAGGGIRGGVVHGSSDRLGAYPASDAVDPVDIHATLYHVMGLDPEDTVHDHLRRPFPLSNGRVISPLLS